MVVQWVYCPRLFYLMHVEGQMVASAEVWRGRLRHRRMDEPRRRRSRRADPAPVPDKGATEPHVPWDKATALELSSTALGITAKLDSVLLDASGQLAIPVELKSGTRPDPERDYGDSQVQGVWAADAVQVCGQALLLEEQRYQVPRAELYYGGSQTLHRLTLDQPLRDRTIKAIQAARETAQAVESPPPLSDSPKCARCSLLAVCLPEETALLRQGSICELDDPDAAEPRVRRILPARIDEVSLVAATPGATVHKDGEALRVSLPDALSRDREEPLRVAISSLHEVVLIGRVQITTDAVCSCLERGIPVAWLGGTGRLLGVALPAFGNNVQLRIRQHARAADRPSSLGLARSFVAGKIRNQRTLLRRNSTEMEAGRHDELTSLIHATDRARDHEELMGLEGRAARVYFEGFAELVRQRTNGELELRGRTRRPPRDPVNALLSFGYAVLAKDITAVTFRVGFDPMVGFLHSPGFGRPALALDLMEEFRPLVVDSTVLRLIASHSIGRHDFRCESGSYLLMPGARRTFLGALEQRKQDYVTHPLFGYRLTYQRTMEVQARLLARVLQGEAERYIPITTR